MKKIKKMVWAKDELNPEKAPIKVPIDTFNRLNNQRKNQGYKDQKYFVVVDDPDLPEILIAGPDRRYDLKEVRRLRELENAKVTTSLKKVVEPEEEVKKTKKQI